MTRLTLAMMLFAALLAGCERDALRTHAHGDRAAHEDHGEDHEAPRGPHGGRLLTDGDFAIELALVEGGGRADFRAWARHGDRPIVPSDVELVVELHRLGGRVDRIGFSPQGEFLQGDSAIAEPHSFDVRVTASFLGDTHVWEYASYEGRTVIPAEVAREAGIETDIAGPGTLVETLTLFGTIVPDATRVREVKARFPGVIRSVAHQVGDTVRAGETLATVEANESLRTYAITAPIDGIVTERHAEPGEQAGESPLFEIVDFSRVWAELKVFAETPARRASPRAWCSTTARAPGRRGSSSRPARRSPRHPSISPSRCLRCRPSAISRSCTRRSGTSTRCAWWSWAGATPNVSRFSADWNRERATSRATAI